MASIKQITKKDGSIAFRCTLSIGMGIDGKYQRKVVIFEPKATTPARARKEALAYASNLENELKAKGNLNADRLTFSDLFEMWKQSDEAADLTPSVHDAYISIIERYAMKPIGKKALSKISVYLLQELINSIRSTGLSIETIKKIKTALSSVFEYGTRMQIINGNPMKSVRAARKQTGAIMKKQNFFDERQKRLFLSALSKECIIPVTRKAGTRVDGNGNRYDVKGYTCYQTVTLSKQWQLYFRLAVDSGLRRGEAIGLQWQDIDFDNMTITVQRAIAESSSGLYDKGPKSANGYRQIPMSESYAEMLKDWKREQLVTLRKLGTAWQGMPEKEFSEQSVFISDTGKRMHLSSPSHKFREFLLMYNRTIDIEAEKISDPEDREKKLCEKLPLIGLHGLRHTFDSELNRLGVDLKTISELMGHSNIRMTQRYTHSSPIQQRAAIAKMDSEISVSDLQVEETENVRYAA